MADDADRAQVMIEASISAGLQTLKNRVTTRLAPRKSCYFCRETLDGETLFCDSDCSEDYEREKVIRKNRV